MDYKFMQPWIWVQTLAHAMILEKFSIHSKLWFFSSKKWEYQYKHLDSLY